MTTAPADPVAALVRETDFGRYASTLFAPADVRPHLLALYAFDAETARVRDLVSEPLPGEMRLQWWRDALETPDRADAVSHPTARALEAAIAFGKLPRDAFEQILDARADGLYDDPIDTLDALEARLGATESAVLRLACLIAARGRDPGGAATSGFGGVARGLARLLDDFGKLAARGQTLAPADRMAAHGVARADILAGRTTPGLAALLEELRGHARRRLAEARAGWTEIEPVAGPALLPLALVEPDLERSGRRDPFAPPSPPARWRTLLRLWRAGRRSPPF